MKNLNNIQQQIAFDGWKALYNAVKSGELEINNPYGCVSIHKLLKEKLGSEIVEPGSIAGEKYAIAIRNMGTFAPAGASTDAYLAFQKKYGYQLPSVKWSFFGCEAFCHIKKNIFLAAGEECGLDK